MWRQVVIVAVVAGVAGLADSLSPPPQLEETRGGYAPANDREAWALDFLAQLGNREPSGDTVTMVVEWTLAEDSGEGAFSRNNPLNTTQGGFEETQVINGDGVRGYATREAGIDAAIHTVTNGLYNDVVLALLANNADAARRALWASPWAESHYGGGAGWPRYTSPRVCPVDPCWQSGTGYSSGHPGVDLGATMGQPVYAVMDGVAALSSTWPCGNGVMVSAGERQQLVCHLSEFRVGDGATVRTGQQIGEAGSSGLSTGPHVHYEMRVDGANVDPFGGFL